MTLLREYSLAFSLARHRAKRTRAGKNLHREMGMCCFLTRKKRPVGMLCCCFSRVCCRKTPVQFTPLEISMQTVRELDTL